MLKDGVPADDHRGALAWLDDSLEWARPRSRTRLTELLKLVRAEVLLDLQLSESPPAPRTRSNGTFSDTDRSV